MVSREQLLAPPALVQEPVECPGLGTLIVRELTQAEFAEFIASLETTGGRPFDPRYGLKLLGRCAIDETGARLLHDDDVETLGRWKVGVLAPAIAAADRLNGISAPAIQSAEKNS